jgi:ribosomal protein S18 acetylase RimI-like enzyme
MRTVKSQGIAEFGLLFSNAFSRLISYFKRHGVRATFDRTEIAVRRLVSGGRMVIFYHDFPPFPAATYSDKSQTSISFERKASQEEMDERDVARIVNFWNPELTQRGMTERFAIGAALWLVRYDGQLAGYGWTLTGRTVRPYFVPLGPNDIHLFDFLVFPEYRGRRINPSLVAHILDTSGSEGRSRAYIEVAEWNRAELRSLERTDFHVLGVARKTLIMQRTIVEWRRDSSKTVSEL